MRWLILLLLAGCAHKPDRNHPLMVPPDVVVEPGTPPFTAVQIYEAMPVGTRIRMRFEPLGAEPYEERWEVTKATTTECTIHTTIWRDGVQAEDKGETTYHWTELRDHADFRGRPLVEGEETVPSPLGQRTAKTVTVTEDDGSQVTYAFCSDIVGPPVQMRVVKDGQTVLTMTQVDRH